MTKKQKQDLFDCITKVGYKDTEIFLMNYLDGDGFDFEIDQDHRTIVAWFVLWYNKGIFESDLQSVISFIQCNTFSNPKENCKKKTAKPLTEDFKKSFRDRFGLEVRE